MINNAYGMRPFKLTLIDGGYAVTVWIDWANIDSDVKEMGNRPS